MANNNPATVPPLPHPHRDPGLIAAALDADRLAREHRLATYGTDQWCWSWACRYRPAVWAAAFHSNPGVFYSLCDSCHTEALNGLTPPAESWPLRSGPPDPQGVLL